MTYVGVRNERTLCMTVILVLLVDLSVSSVFMVEQVAMQLSAFEHSDRRCCKPGR